MDLSPLISGRVLLRRPADRRPGGAPRPHAAGRGRPPMNDTWCAGRAGSPGWTASRAWGVISHPGCHGDEASTRACQWAPVSRQSSAQHWRSARSRTRVPSRSAARSRRKSSWRLDVAVALAAGKRFINAPGPLLDEGHRSAVELSVVAFTQAGVLVDGQLGVGEGDLRGLHSAVQIGGEDRAMPSSRRRRPSSRACRRPVADSVPGSQPVAIPASLSAVVAWVSYTISMDTRGLLRDQSTSAKGVRRTGGLIRLQQAPQRPWQIIA